MSDIGKSTGAANLARGRDGSERRPGFRAAGLAAARIAGPIVVRHGGGVLTRLKADWNAIVGPQLAASCWPESLARGGTLKLRVAPGRGLEIQHRAPLIVDRVNLFFGRSAVERLALMQAPLPLPPPAAAAPPRALAQGEEAALARLLDGVPDPELRAALGRLGRAVIAAGEP